MFDRFMQNVKSLFGKKDVFPVEDGEEKNWIIGTSQEEGLPIIFRLKTGISDPKIKRKYAWLTIITWKYDDGGNGMPDNAEKMRMTILENTLEEQVESTGTCLLFASRTGNGLKEFEYYIKDRQTFIDELNQALEDHEPYPIEIDFYHDPEWEEYQKISEWAKQ